MNRILTVGAIALAQLALVGVAVAPSLSARLTGETYLLRVAPLDPVDPFRGAYVALSYPDLQRESAQEWDEGGLGTMDDSEDGDLYVTLRPDGDAWVADEWTRTRPADGPYLACSDRSWQIDCGIDSFFLPQDEALAMEQSLRDGAWAEVKIDGRGNGAVVDVRESP